MTNTVEEYDGWPADPFVDGDVVLFTKSMRMSTGNVMDYSYAALRAGGMWYITCDNKTSHEPSKVDWFGLIKYAERNNIAEVEFTHIWPRDVEAE